MAERIPTLPPKERLILELLLSEGSLFGLQLVALSQGALKRGTGVRHAGPDGSQGLGGLGTGIDARRRDRSPSSLLQSDAAR